MEIISKPELDKQALRVPTNVKRVLRSGELGTYDVLHLMGNTVNASADEVNKATDWVNKNGEILAENEKERIENENSRKEVDVARKEAFDNALESMMLLSPEEAETAKELIKTVNDNILKVREDADASATAAQSAMENAIKAAADAEKCEQDAATSVENSSRAVQELTTIRAEIQAMETAPDTDAALVAKVADNASKVEAAKQDVDEVNRLVGNKMLTVDADLEFGDENGNVIARFKDGHIKTKYFDSKKNGEQVATQDYGIFDFCITDDVGNVALGLKNGHIKTRNFDSSKSLEPNRYFYMGSPRPYFSGLTNNEIPNASLENITAVEVHALYDELVESHPDVFCRLANIGENAQGQELRHYVLGYTNTWIREAYGTDINYWDEKSYGPKRIIVSAGTHGDEKVSLYGTYLAIKEIIESNEEYAEFIKSNFIIDICPVVNPYGVDNKTRGNSVTDINRDFDSDNPQPETIAMKALIDYATERNLCAIIDMHNTTGKYAFMVTRYDYAYNELYCRLSYQFNSFFRKNWESVLQYTTGSGYYFYTNFSESTGMLAWYGNQKGFVSTTLEAPRDCDNGSINNKSKSCKITKDLLINAIQTFGTF